MDQLRVVQIRDGDEVREALFIADLVDGGEHVSEIARILSGNDPRSSGLLRDVFPGSVPEGMGAKQTMLLALLEVPKGGFGVGGIYGVTNWVLNVLGPAMPCGLTSAVTQPALFDKELPSGEHVYMVVISPMTIGGIRSVAIGDPHDEDAPTLIPLT